MLNDSMSRSQNARMASAIGVASCARRAGPWRWRTAALTRLAVRFIEMSMAASYPRGLAPQREALADHRQRLADEREGTAVRQRICGTWCAPHRRQTPGEVDSALVATQLWPSSLQALMLGCVDSWRWSPRQYRTRAAARSTSSVA
jgi:hypothetical protein